MKKLITVITVLVMVAPAAMAQEWSFSGSQRFATWYHYFDYGDRKVNGQHNDDDIDWYFQGNSRLEAKVRTDKVTGHIELSLGGSTGNESSDGRDNDVRTRRAYGVWRFTENAWLKVGKDYSPVTELISSQWFDSDASLFGIGEFYGKRPGGLTIGIGGLELAFLTPSYGGGSDSGVNGVSGGDPDAYLPRLEASYKLLFESWFIKPSAGFQWYRVEETDLSNLTGDLDVYSWVLGIATRWNIGPFFLGGQVSYGMNEGNVRSWYTGWNPPAASSAYLKNGNDLANVYTLQAEIIPSLIVTHYLTLEAGLGYRLDNADGAPGPSQQDGLWVVYLNALITMAPGVYLCPEVGYYELMDDRAGIEQGSFWYAGAKWQVDF